MFNRLSVRTALTLATLIFVALVVAVGGVAFFALSSSGAALRSMYQNDLTATRSLAQSNLALLRCRSAKNRYQSLTGKDDAAAAKQLGNAQNYCDTSQKDWDSFASVPVAPAMQAKLDQAKAVHAEMMSKGINPEFDALRAKDFAAYSSIQLHFSSPLYNQFDALATPLAEYTEARAAQRFAQSQSDARMVNIVLLLCALFAAVTGVIVRMVLTRAVVTPVNDMVADFDHISRGDLSQPLVVQGSNEIGQLQSALQRMQTELSLTVSRIRGATESINVASGEIASGNMDLSSRTEQQAASLQETAASMEQITGTVKQNAENARQAAVLAKTATDIADKGSQVVNDVVSTMAGIDESSTRIADIISIIEGIAFQTNILALNAAVEAARAGEEGRGFAVVAGEVRTLAQRSSSAAKEIKALINVSAERVKTGSQLVGEAGRTMHDMRQAVQRVTDIMGEISSASQEQSTGIEQVAHAVNQMDSVTQQNAALVEEAAAAAQSLAQQSKVLSDAVSLFRLRH